MIDHTHDFAAQSWVASANGHPAFPLQNLPLGVFDAGDDSLRLGIAIGDQVLDLAAGSLAGLLPGKFAEAYSVWMMPEKSTPPWSAANAS